MDTSDFSTDDFSFSSPVESVDDSIIGDETLGASPADALNASLSAIPVGPVIAPVSTTSTPQLIGSISNGLASIGNSIGNIFKSMSPTAGLYNTAGQFIPVQGSTAPIYSTSPASSLFANTGSIVSQLFPIVLIVLVLGFVISIFSGKKR